jgi:low affinity Fe/Cu permease
MQPSRRRCLSACAAVTRFTGSTASRIAMLTIVVWVPGPLMARPLAININTGIRSTFPMVFLIQRSQNKDALAI